MMSVTGTKQMRLDPAWCALTFTTMGFVWAIIKAWFANVARVSTVELVIVQLRTDLTNAVSRIQAIEAEHNYIGKLLEQAATGGSARGKPNG